MKALKKKLMTCAIGSVMLLPMNVNAQNLGPHVSVNDYHKTVITQKPYTVEVCTEVRKSGDRTADALMGAIIGGIIGNNVTKDLPDGGTAGAILGGMLGHQNSDAKGGTATQCRKETRYNEEQKTIYSHSIVKFMYEGKQYSVRFQK